MTSMDPKTVPPNGRVAGGTTRVTTPTLTDFIFTGGMMLEELLG